MSNITTHILDTSTGKPAAGVTVVLYHQRNGSWIKTAEATTNNNGRVTGFGNDATAYEAGTYKLEFQSGEYFSRSGLQSFYPFVEITFNVNGDDHYHVPLLLNPFGYTTYRGS